MNDAQMQRLRDLEIMKDWNVSSQQAEQIEEYFFKKSASAVKQKNALIVCAIMTCAYFVTNILPGAPPEESAFQKMVAWLFNASPIVIATITIISMGFWQFVSARLDRAVFSMGFPEKKASQIVQLGNAMRRVRMWGNWAAKL